jgi:predicted acyl esterase
VCENYADITCAVYAVGGWADGYTNAVPRLLAGLPGPRKGVIGPWSHNYPQNGLPGPAIGFLQECLRWWDHWLKGIETGIMDEPMLRAWIQDSVAPRPFYHERPGRWVAEPAWPAPSVEMRTYWLNGGTLDNAPGAETQQAYQGSQFAGAYAGAWCPYGQPADLPPDQRAEDGRSLTFDSAPLEEAMEILGFPEVTLTVAADRPDALLALRLCDVAPAGESLLVSRGCLNLTHRASHEHPEPLEPGKRYNVTVRLDVIGHRIPAGHRWRLSVSPTYWPQAWPSPEPVTLTVLTGQGSQLQLPVRTPQAGDAALAPFGPPECSAALLFEQMRPGSRTRALHHDVANRQLQIVDSLDAGHKRLLASDLEFYNTSSDVYTIVEDDPLSATVRSEGKAGLSRGAWRVHVETSSTMSADAETFYLTHSLDAYESNTRIFTKTGEFRVPRDRV